MMLLDTSHFAQGALVLFDAARRLPLYRGALVYLILRDIPPCTEEAVRGIPFVYSLLSCALAQPEIQDVVLLPENPFCIGKISENP